MGAAERLAHVVVIVGRGALVEHHDDVGPQIFLDGDAAFRGEAVVGAVEVALEGNAVGVDGARIAQAEHLEAAAVGQDGAGPVHEPVQATQIADQFVARAQVEVVGVAEDEGCAQIGQVAGPQRLDGGLGADRGKNGGVDDAVGGVKTAVSRARLACRAVQFKGKFKSHRPEL